MNLHITKDKMKNNQLLTLPPKTMKLFIAFFLSSVLYLTFTLIFANPTHAATFTVATGNDENTDNASCALSEAIQNINDGAQTNTDCVGTGAYGTDDTINLPVGTITLSSDLSEITESITIAGQGMGISIIDGVGGAYNGIELVGTGTEQFTVSGFTVWRTDNRGIESSDGNLIAERIEVYGGSDIGPAIGLSRGVYANNTLGGPITVSMSDIYVHHINTNSVAFNGVAVEGSDTGGGETDVEMENITVANISTSTTGALNGIVLVLFGGVAHTIDARVSNATVTEITNTSDGGLASGLSAAAVSATGDVQLDLEVNNATISGVHGSVSIYGSSGGIGLGGGAASPSYSTDMTLNARNVVVTDSFADAASTNCSTNDLTPIFMGTGTPVINLTSTGGNLSDDNSCSSYFTEPSDQNNLTGLGSTLSALADNGGYIPTMALKQGSPAIDSGITIPTLTTDARGELRPQGNAYDSGAYESPYTLVNEVEDSEVDNLAETGERVLPIIVLATLLIFTSSTSVIWRIKQRT